MGFGHVGGSGFGDGASKLRDRSNTCSAPSTLPVARVMTFRLTPGGGLPAVLALGLLDQKQAGFGSGFRFKV